MEDVDAAEFFFQRPTQSVCGVRFDETRPGDEADDSTVANTVARPPDGSDVAVVVILRELCIGARHIGCGDSCVEKWIGEVGVVVVLALLAL